MKLHYCEPTNTEKRTIKTETPDAPAAALAGSRGLSKSFQKDSGKLSKGSGKLF